MMKMIKGWLKKLGAGVSAIADLILRHLPLKRIILLETYPDFTDNTQAVYRYLKEKRRQGRFRMVWITEERRKAPEGSQCVNRTGNRMERLRWFVLQRRAKVFVSCNRFYLTTLRKDQISLFLTHGSPLKTSPGYKYQDRFDLVLSQSKWLSPYVAQENLLDEGRLVTLGIPRNDDLYHPEGALSKMNFLGYRKVIVWLPTYRQHRNGNQHDMKASGLGMPLLNEPQDVWRLNDLLVRENCLLVIKPHPAQDLRTLRALAASNITLIDNELLNRKGVALYSLLGASDAMLTDYSSVFYDYLLCDKPIGLTVDDYEQYCEKRGFVYEDPNVVLKGAHLKVLEDLLDFLEEVAQGQFPHREELAQVRKLTNDYTDDRSSQRVGDFILELLDRK